MILPSYSIVEGPTKGPLTPLKHHSTMLSGIQWGVFNWAPIMSMEVFSIFSAKSLRGSLERFTYKFLNAQKCIFLLLYFFVIDDIINVNTLYVIFFLLF